MTSTISGTDDDKKADGQIMLEKDSGVWTLTISRPSAHNAMTETMYSELETLLAAADESTSIRALVIRGAGDSAFASGTDIKFMSELNTGGRGVRYETQLTETVTRLERLRVPTVAVIQGHCYGGGLVLAAACDIRIASSGSRFGVPIAKTLGNCLSANSLSLLTSRLGTSRVVDMLVTARTYDTLELMGVGFLSEVVEPNSLGERLKEIMSSLTLVAPLTVWSTKELIYRQRVATLPFDQDVLQKIYGSEDFKIGSHAFLTRRRAQWTGR